MHPFSHTTAAKQQQKIQRISNASQVQAKCLPFSQATQSRPARAKEPLQHSQIQVLPESLDRRQIARRMVFCPRLKVLQDLASLPRSSKASLELWPISTGSACPFGDGGPLWEGALDRQWMPPLMDLNSPLEHLHLGSLLCDLALHLPRQPWGLAPHPRTSLWKNLQLHLPLESLLWGLAPHPSLWKNLQLHLPRLRLQLRFHQKDIKGHHFPCCQEGQVSWSWFETILS